MTQESFVDDEDANNLPVETQCRDIQRKTIKEVANHLQTQSGTAAFVTGLMASGKSSVGFEIYRQSAIEGYRTVIAQPAGIDRGVGKSRMYIRTIEGGVPAIQLNDTAKLYQLLDENDVVLVDEPQFIANPEEWSHLLDELPNMNGSLGLLGLSTAFNGSTFDIARLFLQRTPTWPLQSYDALNPAVFADYTARGVWMVQGTGDITEEHLDDAQFYLQLFRDQRRSLVESYAQYLLASNYDTTSMFRVHDGRKEILLLSPPDDPVFAPGVDRYVPMSKGTYQELYEAIASAVGVNMPIPNAPTISEVLFPYSLF